MSKLFTLILLLSIFSCANMQQAEEQEDEPQPEHYDGRSFFFLGTLFRRWRDRWVAFHSPASLYAGAAYPINGYFNCPAFGCNPATIGPQPGYYPNYYSLPLQQQQQQQQAQGNSNVYIYQTDQNSANSGSMTPYGTAYLGPGRQPPSLGGPLPPPPLPLPLPPPLPLPLPPSTLLPPGSTAPQASASSFGFGCGPGTLSCALG